MATDRLQEFLDSQVEGEVESEGGFTITSDKAIQKLAQLCLENPHDWVLKAVQAAVAAGSHRLSFQQTRAGLTVEFFGIEAPSNDAIKDEVLSSSSGKGSFLSELAIGLRTLLFQGPFVLSQADGDSLFWDGQEFSHCQREPKAANLTVWLLKKGWSITAARAGVAREGILRTRALYAPLELLYDGLRLTPSDCLASALTPREAFTFRRSTALVAASFEPCDSVKPLRAEVKPNRWLTDKLRVPGFLLRYHDSDPASPRRVHYHTWAEFEDHPGGEHSAPERVMLARWFKIQYTRLGVVCGELSFQHSIQGALQLPLDEARTDLSGLSVAPAPPKETVDQTLLAQIQVFNQNCLDAIRANRGLLHLDVTDLKRTLVGTGGGTAGVAGMLMLNGLKFVLATKVGLAGGLIVGWSALSTGMRKVTRDQLNVLIQATERFNQCVSPERFHVQDWTGSGTQ